jgi:ferredoxin-type protein NapF
MSGTLTLVNVMHLACASNRFAPRWSMDPIRRRLLGGRLPPATSAYHPPWAGESADFLRRCTRCGACVKACPVQLLRPGAGGFPEAQFRQVGCSLCGDCVSACEPRALDKADGRAAFLHVAQIEAPCLALQGVECRVCGEACEAGAIRFRLQIGAVAQPALDLSACTGCGECLAVCPSNAIALQARELEPDGDGTRCE